MGGSDDDLAREWHELMGRYHRISCVLDRELEQAHGISGSDFEVLQQLALHGDDGSLRMHELAGHVHLTQSALSRLVSRLERDGLVDRSMCPDDRRSVSTCITPAGRERFEQARATQRHVLRNADTASPAADSRR
ncbi:MarR family winged helix-turn-helix transcriptional regulator [Jatrophihabitans sp. YIM 134969]